MKPRLKIIAGRPITVREESVEVAAARRRFGRSFAHESGGNWLEYPERVLSRWARRADYFNLDCKKPRPVGLVCHFRDRTR